MKHAVLIFFLSSWFVPAAFAQSQAEIGAYADYFHLSQTSTNLAGLGGRFSLNPYPHIGLEAEMSYDFEQAFTEGFTNGTGTITTRRTNIRLLHGLFGPKVHTGGPIQLFATVKGGFINFRLDPRPATFGTFASSVQNLRANTVSGVLYPGAGLEGHMGPLGLRLDVGDEIYLNGGAHHDLRVTFGPIIHF
jgi:hypothetical protein